MAENLSKIKGQLKAQWLAANRKVLELRQRVSEAEKQAADLQRAMDALDKVSPGTGEAEPVAPSRRGGRRSGILRQIVETLREKGAMDPRALAAEIGASYWAVLSHLKRGPFRQQEREGGDGRIAKKWELLQAEAGNELSDIAGK